MMYPFKGERKHRSNSLITGDMTESQDFPDLNIPKGLFPFHIVFNDKVSVDNGALTSWTFLLLLQRWREGDVCLQNTRFTGTAFMFEQK